MSIWVSQVIDTELVKQRYRNIVREIADGIHFDFECIRKIVVIRIKMLDFGDGHLKRTLTKVVVAGDKVAAITIQQQMQRYLTLHGFFYCKWFLFHISYF